VPEQTDFVKFIAHFGTDFGAIANHMGTKTQTMVRHSLLVRRSQMLT
jgi:serine/arginine repetitive matrix protein 2